MIECDLGFLVTSSSSSRFNLEVVRALLNWLYSLTFSAREVGVPLDMIAAKRPRLAATLCVGLGVQAVSLGVQEARADARLCCPAAGVDALK